MNQMTHAYAAGLIDGEGCILIQKSKGPTYHHLVTVGMTEKAIAILKTLQHQYGGAVKCARKKMEKWDAAYAWTVAGDEATNLLEATHQYLRLKQEQARIALRVDEIRKDLPPRWPSSPTGQRLWTQEARDRCETLKRRMHELNAKGPSKQSMTKAPSGARAFAQVAAGQVVELQGDLFSDLGWAPYSGSFPVSGSMRSGVLYEHPQSEHRTEGSASSSSPGDETPLLRTVMADELGGGMMHPEKATEEGRSLRLASQVVNLVAPDQLAR